MASQIARLITTLGLLLLGATPAWAGRGDIDPNYGEEGGVPISSSATLALPGDRLVITEAIDGGLRVRMVDAAGKVVTTFGESGVVEIASPEAAWPFWPDVAAHAPNGDMIFAGSRLDTGARELLRLDSDGQPVASFGDRGDGFVEPALATAQPMAFAVDPDGRIVLAEGSWNSDFSSCEGVARIQRLLVNGQPDTGFGGDGLVEIPDLNICGGAVVFGARADGSVVVGDGQAIVAVNSAGDNDLAFGAGGRLYPPESVWTAGFVLPDESLLAYYSIRQPTGIEDAIIAKFDKNGLVDAAFGSGTGQVRLDDVLAYPEVGGIRGFIDRLMLAPDSAHLYARITMRRADASIFCVGIARYSIDGTFDGDFGRGGLTCLNFDHSLIAVQSTGAPLFLAGYDNSIHRLLPDNSPSPGLLRVYSPYVHVNESDGTANVAVERLAGRDGAVSVDYTTSPRARYWAAGYCHGCGFWVESATAGSDYKATSGRLDWASGDASQQTVTVKIDRDQRAENLETFGVDFSEPGGGAPLVGSSTTVMIHNVGQGSPTNSGQDDSTGAEGGGGSVSWATTFALLALIFIRRRSDRRAVAWTTALPGLMLLGTAAAWAGRGDIDPNYGEGGRLATGPSVLLALPADRLVIAEGTDQGLRIRMVDAAGRSVPTFGDDGVVLIDSSAAARNFRPEAAALAPEGDMVFMGSMLDTQAREILRLDSDGQPVVSFGSRGDGFVEPTLTAAQAPAIAVDPSGKIVLAEGSGSQDGDCGSTARVQRLLANGQPDGEFGGDGIIEIPDLAIFCSDGVLVFGPRADGGVIIGNEQTIVAVDVAGNIDPTFGVNGHLDISELDPNGDSLMPDGGLLSPDGGLLFFGSSTLTGTGDTVFRKFDRNGQPDLNFGGGTGSITVDLGAAFQEVPSSREYIGQLALDPDGEHVVAHIFLSTGISSNTQRRLLCSGIMRLSLDGSLDDGFGRNGLTCLNIVFGLIAVQSDGAPLFADGIDNSIHRLLPDNRPSPGFLSVASSINSFTRLSEYDTATVTTVVRVAGRDGAVGVNYATVVRPGLGYPATAGSDYMATSGRLDWADGDDSPRTVTVSILEDTIDEPSEIFGVEISEPSDGVQLIGAIMTAIISDDDEASTTPPQTDPGGGGSVSWATAFALLCLLLLRRRNFWQRAVRIRWHEK